MAARAPGAPTANWTNASGALNGPYQPIPSFTVFQGAAGTVTVDQSVGAIGVTGMQFATDGYLVQGDPIALQAPPARAQSAWAMAPRPVAA